MIGAAALPRRPPVGRIAVAALAIAAAAIPATGASAPPDREAELRRAWYDATRFLLADTYRRIERLAEALPEDRMTSLALAVALLNRQPRTPGSLADAGRRLAALVDAGAGDDVEAWSMYYLARLAHRHGATPDLPTAARWYERTIATHPATLPGEYARVKLATLRIFSPPEGTRRALLLESLESWPAAISRPEVRRQLHMVLALGYQLFGVDRRAALCHYRSAEEIGLLKDNLDANLKLRIAVLALRVRETGVARDALTRFIARYPRNNRAHTASRIVALLDAGRLDDALSAARTEDPR